MKVSLRAARVNRNLSQSQAADKLQVSRKTVQNWENGTSMPNAKHIPLIEAVYKCSYDDIIFLPSNNALSVK